MWSIWDVISWRLLKTSAMNLYNRLWAKAKQDIREPSRPSPVVRVQENDRESRLAKNPTKSLKSSPDLTPNHHSWVPCWICGYATVRVFPSNNYSMYGFYLALTKISGKLYQLNKFYGNSRRSVMSFCWGREQRSPVMPPLIMDKQVDKNDQFTLSPKVMLSMLPW